MFYIIDMETAIPNNCLRICIPRDGHRRLSQDLSVFLPKAGTSVNCLSDGILTFFPEPACKTRFEVSSKTDRFGIVLESFWKTLPQSDRNRLENSSGNRLKLFRDRFRTVLESLEAPLRETSRGDSGEGLWPYASSLETQREMPRTGKAMDKGSPNSSRPSLEKKELLVIFTRRQQLTQCIS